ncbi:MAG: NTP transferase domain-containing protein [Candidatus Aminicenantes bacterium]
MIAAVILAAGESRRMGRAKLLLPFGRKSIIQTVVDHVLRSEADKVVVVLGGGAEKIKPKIGHGPLLITLNPDYKKGMLSSVQWGFKNLPPDTEAVLICLGDQPSISSDVIDEIIHAYRQTKKGIVIPVYRNNRGHPVLIDIKYQKEVDSLNPDIGLRQLVYSHPEDTFEVEVRESSILRDIDDPDDYKREEEKSRKNG